MEFAHSDYVPVGQKGVGPKPIIRDLDWNLRPGDCTASKAKSIIACVSTVGTKVYKQKKSSDGDWKLMGSDPSATGGSTLQWCPTRGTMLATGCMSSTQGYGKVSLLMYNISDRKFYLTEVEIGLSVSSLCWTSSGRYLAVGLPFVPAIKIYKMVTKNEMTIIQTIHHPHGTSPDGDIIVKFIPDRICLISCNPKSDKIMVWWGKERVSEIDSKNSYENYSIEWFVSSAIDCDQHIIGMSLNRDGSILATIGRFDRFKIWEFIAPTDGESKPKLNLLSDKSGGHSSILNRGCRRGHSDVLSVDVSRMGTRIVTGGDHDTLLIYADTMNNSLMWEIVHKHVEEVNWGQVTCVKMNPKASKRSYLAIGGDNGFIYFFAYYDKKNTALDLKETPYAEHKRYYSRVALEEDSRRKFNKDTLVTRLKLIEKNAEDLVARHESEYEEMMDRHVDEFEQMKEKLMKVQSESTGMIEEFKAEAQEVLADIRGLIEEMEDIR